MKNYKVFEGQVVELPTNQVIRTFPENRSAKVFANRLNGGQGFAGRTPRFLLQRFDVAI